MNDQYHIFPRVSSLVNDEGEKRPFIVADLGCSPGGWSQASLELLGKPWNSMESEDMDEYSIFEEEDVPNPSVIGVDLIATEPILGARFVQGNFLDASVQDHLQDILGGPNVKFDIILSDMAPNLSGNRVADIEASLELCRSVLEFSKRNLRPAQGKGSKSGTLM